MRFLYFFPYPCTALKCRVASGCYASWGGEFVLSVMQRKGVLSANMTERDDGGWMVQILQF